MTPGERLVSQFPQAWRFFSASPELFKSALALWDVLEDSECWIMLEGVGPHRELHWFCPHGADMPALRRMLHLAFTSLGVRSVSGTQPAAHPNKKAACVLARALGARRDGDRLVLTTDQFKAYSGQKPENAEGISWAAS